MHVSQPPSLPVPFYITDLTPFINKPFSLLAHPHPHPHPTPTPTPTPTVAPGRWPYQESPEVRREQRALGEVSLILGRQSLQTGCLPQREERRREDGPAPQGLGAEQGVGSSEIRVIKYGRVCSAVASGTSGSTQEGGRGRRKMFS